MLWNDDNNREQFLWNGTKTDNPKFYKFKEALRRVENRTGGLCVLINADPDRHLKDDRDNPLQLSTRGGIANARLILTFAMFSPDAWTDDNYDWSDM